MLVQVGELFNVTMPVCLDCSKESEWRNFPPNLYFLSEWFGDSSVVEFAREKVDQLYVADHYAYGWMAYMHMLAFSGESIPIRLFLSPYELTPTHRNINNKFSVKYYLNLVLVDEEDRRYFKQQEITIYRLQDSSWSLIPYAIPNWFG